MLFYASLAVVALALVGLVVLVRAALVAPYAVEDERGFHLVDTSEGHPSATLSPVPVAEPDVAFFHR